MKPKFLRNIFFTLLGLMLFSCEPGEDFPAEKEIALGTSLVGFEGRLPNNFTFGTAIKASNHMMSAMNLVQKMEGTHVLTIIDSKSGWELHVSFPVRVMPEFPAFNELQSHSEYLGHFKKGYSYEMILEILESEMAKALADPTHSSIGDFSIRVKQNNEERYIHNFHDPVESGMLQVLRVEEGMESFDSGVQTRKIEVEFGFDVNMSAAYLETQPQTGKLKGKGIMKFSEAVFEE